MFTDFEVKKTKEFLEILKNEVSRFDKELISDVNNQRTIIEIRNEYKSHFFINAEYEVIVKLDLNIFKEKDFTDGLVRLRFEVMRYLNPEAF